ncbi:AMP-binding protein [Rhodococcus sp. C26F]
MGQIPHEHAARHSRRSKTAVLEGAERFTWGEVSERTARLANALATSGVTRGDKVAAIMPNRAQYVEAVYAVAGLGAAIVPISYRFVPAEMEYAIAHSEAVAVIVDASLLDTFREAHQNLPQISDDRVLVLGPTHALSPYRDYETVLAGSDTNIDYLDMDEWDVYHLVPHHATFALSTISRSC